jgi:hypothetical protein
MSFPFGQSGFRLRHPYAGWRDVRGRAGGKAGASPAAESDRAEPNGRKPMSMDVAGPAIRAVPA